MICPNCLHELTVDGNYCPRCGYDLPRPGARAAATLRLIAVVGGLVILCAIVLGSCVMRLMPDSGSLRNTAGVHPDAKSAEVKNLLRAWQQGQQPSQNPTPPPPAR